MNLEALSSPPNLKDRLRQFFTLVDERFEDYKKGNPITFVIRDFLTAVIVALVAIPLCVGFAIASGLRPEQGIIAGAIAGILGGLFGGSKYQVYGPTAAFITIIAGIVHSYNVPFLILATLISGVIILAMGLFGLGRYFRLVPHSIIVGFTIGIAITIVISQMPDILGAHGIKISHVTLEKLQSVPSLFKDANAHSLVLAMLTFIIIRLLYKITVFIPAPLIAIAVGAFIANVIWHDNFVPLVATKYGSIGEDLFRFTLPSLGQFGLTDLFLPVLSIVFIAALESLLSSRMADRLANNPTPYNPDKELFGQGLVNLFVPLLNGFACTGALARTATGIKVGAVSPLASILQGFTIIILMLFFSNYLKMIPMACMGGLLVFVASNMVKPQEVKGVWQEGLFPTFIMLYTAVMTVVTDLSIAVGTATVLYYVLKPILIKFIPKRLAPVFLEEQIEDVFKAPSAKT